MAKPYTVHENAVIEAIEWDRDGLHGLRFRLGEEVHETVFHFDPIISHISAPKNRLHRWLLQPGAVANVSLPDSAAENLKIEIVQYADSQYIPGVYTNHEGITAIRSMVPLRTRLEETKWHGLAHTITGWDKDRQAERTYALADWDFTKAGVSRFNLATEVEADLKRVLEDRLVWVQRDPNAVRSDWEDAYDPEEPSPRELYVVNRGDTLGDIALRFYQRANLWPLLAKANGMQPGQTIIVTGQTLWIPSLKGKRQR